MATDESSTLGAATLQATIVAPVLTPELQALTEELRRDAMQVDARTADVLREPALKRVYVFRADASLAVVLAERIVQWGGGFAGLIGVIADGGGAEREALLAAGFDDVVDGNVSVRELSARIRSVHRRIHTTARTGRLRFGAFALDVLNRTLWTQGHTITLTSTELEVMRALIEARGRPLSRLDLLELVWGGSELEVTERAVDNVILRLRRKMPDPTSIETVRGVGFRLA